MTIDVRLNFLKRLPVIIQTESSECGLACLAMVANYFGHAVDLAALRRRLGNSARGVTLSKLISHANALGMDARALRISLRHLSQLQTPCILHWDLNHFVVLKRVTSKRVAVHDPATGYRSLTLAEAGGHFTGVALELQPVAQFAPIQDQQHVSLRALIGEVRGVKGTIIQTLLLASGLELLTLVIPLYVQAVLDQVVVTGDSQLLALLAIGFLLIVTARGGLNLARGWAITWISGRFGSQWSGNLFRSYLKIATRA